MLSRKPLGFFFFSAIVSRLSTNGAVGRPAAAAAVAIPIYSAVQPPSGSRRWSDKDEGAAVECRLPAADSIGGPPLGFGIDTRRQPSRERLLYLRCLAAAGSTAAETRERFSEFEGESGSETSVDFRGTMRRVCEVNARAATSAGDRDDNNLRYELFGCEEGGTRKVKKSNTRRLYGTGGKQEKYYKKCRRYQCARAWENYCYSVPVATGVHGGGVGGEHRKETIPP